MAQFPFQAGLVSDLLVALDSGGSVKVKGFDRVLIKLYSIFFPRTRHTQDFWHYFCHNVRCLTKCPNTESKTTSAFYVRAVWNAMFLDCYTTSARARVVAMLWSALWHWSIFYVFVLKRSTKGNWLLSWQICLVCHSFTWNLCRK